MKTWRQDKMDKGMNIIWALAKPEPVKFETAEVEKQKRLFYKNTIIPTLEKIQQGGDHMAGLFCEKIGADKKVCGCRIFTVDGAFTADQVLTCVACKEKYQKPPEEAKVPCVEGAEISYVEVDSEVFHNSPPRNKSKKRKWGETKEKKEDEG